MYIPIKTKEELQHMREGGKILGSILSELKKMIAPGVSCLELDQKAVDLMEKYKVIASFKGYQGFPKTICACINEEVVHGIPSDRKLQEGDIITIDCGVLHKGFHTDSAITVGVGKISKDAQKLIDTTEKALEKAIKTIKPGIRVNKLGEIIERTVTKKGFEVIHDLTGHGIGRELHEDPHILNFKDNEPGPILKEDMTIAIEPIISAGKGNIKLAKDSWTYLTVDGSLSAQAEHTIAITEKGAEILTKRQK